jgi:dTDP-4-amino-4,6-dideoxygalactose transaminase
MHLQPVFAGAPYYGADVSEKLFKNGLCLPSGSNISDAELHTVTSVILHTATAVLQAESTKMYAL